MDENPYRAPEEEGTSSAGFWPTIQRPWRWCAIFLIVAAYAWIMRPKLARPADWPMTFVEIVIIASSLVTLAVAGFFAMLALMRTGKRGSPRR